MDSFAAGIGLMIVLSIIVGTAFWFLMRRFFGADQLDTDAMEIPILPLVIIGTLIVIVIVGGVAYSINGDEWNFNTQKIQDFTLTFVGVPIVFLLIYREIITPLLGVIRTIRKERDEQTDHS